MIDPPDDDFLSRFEHQAFEPAEWTHEAHIHVAFLYLRAHSFDEAVKRLRVGLRALIQHFGIVETPDRGYHETITVAWAQLVASTMAQHGPIDAYPAFAEANPHLYCKTALRFFYSRERLRTPAARSDFVSPDLAAMPTITSGRVTE